MAATSRADCAAAPRCEPWWPRWRSPSLGSCPPPPPSWKPTLPHPSTLSSPVPKPLFHSVRHIVYHLNPYEPISNGRARKGYCLLAHVWYRAVETVVELFVWGAVTDGGDAAAERGLSASVERAGRGGARGGAASPSTTGRATRCRRYPPGTRRPCS